MMGFYQYPGERSSLIESESTENVFPEKPVIDTAVWKKIQAYYLASAPEVLEVDDPVIKTGLDDFKLIIPKYKVTPPSSTLVKFMDDQTIFVGDALSKKLLHFDNELNFTKAGNILEGAVHMEEDDESYWILSMGSFSPSDHASGMLINLPKRESKRARIIADQLRRPVHAAYGDLNDDGYTDIVISEFAKWTGRLSILYGKENNEFGYEILHNQTGAIKSFIKDFNRDGRPDIMTLFAQGKEGISIFYNQGDGTYRREEVISFPSFWGSTSFELFDLENDGDWDILYTAGDNGDYIPVLKPYHGVYIYQNNGDDAFKQVFFHHMNGANGAKIKDFDLDGDLDIAAISFFPDYNNKAKESFIYLKNAGDLNFEAQTFDNNSRGRWIVMDAKDKDKDGDIDLILGSLIFETIPDSDYIQKWIKTGLPFVILENQTKK